MSVILYALKQLLGVVPGLTMPIYCKQPSINNGWCSTLIRTQLIFIGCEILLFLVAITGDYCEWLALPGFS